MSASSIPINVKGHLTITDDLGNVLVDQDNAIHPQNMARIIARALANEHNYFINRIAFGNGGTTIDAAYTVTYKKPNDGQSPDVSTWDSRIYKETYSEIIDEGQITLNPLLGHDLGSADINTGVRTGRGSVPENDPVSVPHVSGPGVRSSEYGLISQVVISATINGSEPTGQFASNPASPGTLIPSQFVFDEVGLYTGGAVAIDTSGSQLINVGNRNSTNNTGLVPGSTYSFNIRVDGGTPTVITFKIPTVGAGTGAGGQILYGDLCQAINTGNPSWNTPGGSFTGVNPLPGGAVISITDTTGGTFSTITGAQTYGYLKVESPTVGVTSAVSLSGALTNTFIAALNPPSGATLILATPGTVAGLQNAPTVPSTERERLLTHLIFSPVLKFVNRTLSITYTLTISVARTT
jgi:hypothetical protein